MMTSHLQRQDDAHAGLIADQYRDAVIEAAAGLLADVHDIDFHHYNDDVGWPSCEPTDYVAETVLHLADRLLTAATDARDSIHAARGRRDWLTTGRALRCIACDDPINPVDGEWQVCRWLPEHTYCHRDDPAAEDTDRRITWEEAEHEAYLDERARTGGPRPGDYVRLTAPDGSRQHAIWHAGPDGTSGPRTDDYHAHPIDLTDQTIVEIIELVEDTGIYGPDGAPIEADLLAVMSAARCGICYQPITAPAVWARSYPVHQPCLDTLLRQS